MSKKLEALASSMQVEFVHSRHFNNEYRYQHGRTGAEAIYCTGHGYYAIQRTAPKFEGNTPWVPHEDQFFASQLPGNLTVWYCE